MPVPFGVVGPWLFRLLQVVCMLAPLPDRSPPPSLLPPHHPLPAHTSVCPAQQGSAQAPLQPSRRQPCSPRSPHTLPGCGKAILLPSQHILVHAALTVTTHARITCRHIITSVTLITCASITVKLVTPLCSSAAAAAAAKTEAAAGPHP